MVLFALVASVASAGLAACSGQRPELVAADQTTTSALPGATVADNRREPSDCATAAGRVPFTIAIEATPVLAVPCVLVAGHQRVEYVNNTTEQISFVLAGTPITIEPGATHLTEPAGRFLAPGPNEVEAEPHPASGPWLLGPDANTLAGSAMGLTSIGPIELGLAPAEVTAALGGSPVVASGTPCYVTFIQQDPYSPLLTFRDGLLAVIQTFTPGQLTRSEVGVGSAEGDVLATYGRQIESQPSPDGDPDDKLLVFVPEDEADRQYRLVFVVEDGVVVGVRTGLTEPALSEPGCPAG